MSLFTTECAPITQRRPIVTPFVTTACGPMYVWSPIVTGACSYGATPPDTAHLTVSWV